MSDLAKAPPRSGMGVVVLMALGFGLVGIDRFLITAMYPVIAKDLGLDYGDIGTITGALAIAWGLAALFMGNLSDRIGRRRVIVWSLVMFSLLIGISGLAESLFALVLVRIAMGFADGAFTPPSISATLEASPVEKRGRNIGIQQMTLTLFGLGLAPLLVSELLHVINWRWIFSIFIVPGLALALLAARMLPGRRSNEDDTSGHGELGSVAAWRSVLRYRNVRVLGAGMLCWLVCLVTTSAFLPNYLIDHLQLSTVQMGRVMSAIGFGAAAGTLLLPWLSDAVGRKPVMVVSTVGAILSIVAMMSIGADTALLFATLFCVHFFNNALITLTVGPVCTETVPPHLMATASGVIIAIGELGGGGLGPILAGRFAMAAGIEHLLWLPIAALALGFLLCVFGLRETRQTGKSPIAS